MKFMQPIYFLLRDLWQEWQNDDIALVAAALSYYAIFSIAPLLVIVIALAGVFFGQAAVEGQIVAQFSQLLGEQTAQLLSDMIKSVSDTGRSLFATIIGIGLLLFGATNVFFQLEKSLNRIWNVQPGAQGGGVVALLRKRLLSFAFVLVLGVLLVVSLVFNSALAAVEEYFVDQVVFDQVAVMSINNGVSLLVLTILFALLYRVLPDAEVRWGDVLPGALITSILFQLGQYGIQQYIVRVNPASAFGAAGSLVVLLVWVFYSMQILLIGAEFTQVFAHHFGSKKALGSLTTELEDDPS